MNQLPERMKLLRSQRGLGQKELAATLNCSVSAISAYEHGRNEPELDMLIGISRHYNVSVDYLLGITDLPDPVDQRLHMVSKNYPVSRFLMLLKKLSTKDRIFLSYGFRILEKFVDKQKT